MYRPLARSFELLSPLLRYPVRSPFFPLYMAFLLQPVPRSHDIVMQGPFHETTLPVMYDGWEGSEAQWIQGRGAVFDFTECSLLAFGKGEPGIISGQKGGNGCFSVSAGESGAACN